MKLAFDFHGYVAVVDSECEDLTARLRKDFSAYVLDAPAAATKLTIAAHLSAPPKGLLPDGLRSTAQSANSITYDSGRVRFNDYYGEALSVFDYASEQAQVYSPSLERLHEIVYLLILSRCGKYHDRHGLHRVHAFSVATSETTWIGMMPMKGGKTTLFLKLLAADQRMKIVSDDTPLVTLNGRIKPFAIRVGCEANHVPGTLSQVDPNATYRLERKQYGPKILIDIRGLGRPLSDRPPSRVILFQGIRQSGPGCEVRPCGRLRMLRHLGKNMIVGVGLPMVIEYFLESTPLDWLRNAGILFSRTWAAMALVSRSQCYEVLLGNDPDLNARVISTRFSDEPPGMVP